MGAMLVFALFSLSSSGSFQSNTEQIIRNDLEYRTITNAQNEIDHIRLITDESALDSTSSNYYFANFPHVKTITYGPNHEFSEDLLIKGHAYFLDQTANVRRYKIEVSAESKATSNKLESTVEFIKTFRR